MNRRILRVTAGREHELCGWRLRGATMAVLASLAAGAALAQGQGGADSPQALLTAAQQAGAERDGTALVRLVAPSQLHLLAFETDMAADVMSELSEDEETRTILGGLAKLRSDYDVRPDADDDQPPLEVGPDTPQEEIDAHVDARARRRYENVDLVGYVSEVTALLLSTPKLAGQPLFPPGEITDIQEDGDGATARVGEQKIELMREEGRWYLARLGP